MTYQIKEVTIVSGWNHDVSGSAEEVFEGHIDLNEAIERAGEKVRTVEGAHVTAYHSVIVTDLDKLSGCVGEQMYAAQFDGRVEK